jgi:hypothetical protein
VIPYSRGIRAAFWLQKGLLGSGPGFPEEKILSIVFKKKILLPAFTIR